MRIGLAAPYALVTALSAIAAEPKLLWSYETKGKIYAPPVLADLEGDGQSEVLVAASRDKRILCLTSAGDLRWEFRIDDGSDTGIQAPVSSIDHDGDGRREVFFASGGGVVGCLDSVGTLLWRTHLNDAIDYTGPVLADIDNDGHIDLLLGSESGTVYCLDETGGVRWRYQGNGAVRGIPAVAKHTPTDTSRVYATFAKGQEVCLSADGTVVWSFIEPSPRGERFSTPVVGDLDADGDLEVVTATEDFAVIVRDAHTGVEQWRWKGQGRIDETNTFALADFDGSGRLDIVAADGAGQGGPGHIYRLRDGAPRWTADAGGSVVQGPVVGDVDGDGALDVVVCSRSKRLICFSDQGAEKWSYPSATEVITTPAIGDLNANGQTEIVFTSKDRFVYCVTLEGAFHAERVPWPMIQRGPQLAGNGHGAPFAATPAPPPPSELVEVAIDRFASLRLGDNTARFRFANKSPRPRRLEAYAAITQPDGSLVSHTVTARLAPYELRLERFDFAALEPGPYSLRIRLRDLGTGEAIASAEATETFTPLAEDDLRIGSFMSEHGVLFQKLQGEALKQRAAQSLAHCQALITTQLQAATAAVQPGQPRSVRAKAAKDLRASIAVLGRHVARMRAASTIQGEMDFAVIPDTTMSKVFKDDRYLANGSGVRAFSVSLARNEAEGLQLVVVPLWKDLANLRVSASDLTHTGGAGTIPSAQIAIHAVGYVETGPSEYNFFVGKQGAWPDILLPNTPLQVPAAQDAQPFFLTLKTAPDTAPGDYTGSLRVEADGSPPFDAQLTVHVWDFALPAESRLKTSLWMSESDIARFYKFTDRVPFEVRKRWYDAHLAYRIGPLRTFPIAAGGGDIVEDFAYVIANGQKAFFIDVPVHIPEAERAAFAEKLRATQAILREKGWDPLAIVYTPDELSVMHRWDIPQALETSKFVKATIPEWPRLQTSAPEEALLGIADIWCPLIDDFDPRVLGQRMQKGERLWFYTVWGRPGIMIEFPGSDHRLMFWQCWKYGAEGFLYYGTTHWDLNLKTDARWPDTPWIPWNSQPGHNGCGYLFYPGADATPLPSIRVEIVRDGIEDYEYLYLLREALAAAGAAAPPELRAKAEAELRIDPRVLVDHKTFTQDPQAILEARARIAQLIEQLRRLPPPEAAPAPPAEPAPTPPAEAVPAPSQEAPPPAAEAAPAPPAAG